MKKRRYLVMGMVCILLFCLTSCQKKEEGSGFPTPIQPETFVSDGIVNGSDFFEVKSLPWNTGRVEVRKALEGYELFREDALDDWYRADTKLEDGTSVQELVLLGYMETEEGTLEAQELAIVEVQFYIEEADGAKAKQMAEQMIGTMNQWAEADGQKSYTKMLKESSMELVKKDTKACLQVLCYPDAGKGQTEEYPYTSFEEFSLVRVGLWPMDKWGAMITG